MQHLQPYTTLQDGKYRIERVLGQGNFGITYLARQTQPLKTVAIKELFLSVQGINNRQGNLVVVPNPSNKPMFEQQVNKFKKEARRIMSLNDEHIVPVYDLFEENNTAYYVMEYVEGESLADRMKRLGHPFTVEEVQYIFPQILDALSAIHSQQLLHLDIKPGNIMIDGEGVVRLIDFGASKQLTSEETAMTGFYFTIGYAPSEQTGMLFNRFGPWTDLYAVGATMYNLLTGNSPIQFDIEEFTSGEIPEDTLGLMFLMINWMMQPQRQDRPQKAVHVKQRYYVELVKIGVLSILSETLNREITKTIGQDIDLTKDLHVTPMQCMTIKKKITETFGVDVTGIPFTYDNLVVSILTSLGLYILDDEQDGQDENTIFETAEASPRVFKINNHEAVDLGLSVLWATMDVGASSEERYGDCFLWGDPNGEKTKKVLNSFWARWLKGGPTINNISGNKQYDTATYMWGSSWRMPTAKEFEELATQCIWELIDNKHVKITGPNGNSIVLDNRWHWTGESPFGQIIMFYWTYQNNEIRWSMPSTHGLGKDYTDLFFPVRPVASK